MAVVQETKDEVPAGWRGISIRPGTHRDRVDRAMAALKNDRIMHRIWAHDHTVWKLDRAEIANRLGWLHIANKMGGSVPRLAALVRQVRADGLTSALVLGSGGAGLAAKALQKTFGTQQGYLNLAVLDSTAPCEVLSHIRYADPLRTLFIVASKTGETLEVPALFKFFYNRMVDAVGEERAGEHFVAITDPGSWLAGIADRYRFRATFLNDPLMAVGYAALSHVGLVPAAFLGVDVALLLRRAAAMACSCGSGNGVVAGDNPGGILGTALAEFALAGRDKATLITSPGISGIGGWIEHLIAGSMGTDREGIVPVVGEPVGPPEVYANDRAFVYLRLRGCDGRALDEAVTKLEAAGHPVIRIRLNDRYDLGAQFFLWQMATAVAGARLRINPFDQPRRRMAREETQLLTAAYQTNGALPDDEPALLKSDTLRDFLARARPGDYIAIQAYVPPKADADAALETLRTRLRDRTRLAVTVGYGPRYLHATGRLHDGDNGHGLFIQFTSDGHPDPPIPDDIGSPSSSISFGVLHRAQAIGDRDALRRAGRRVIRFHLGSDVVGGLQLLTQSLDEAAPDTSVEMPVGPALCGPPRAIACPDGQTASR